MNLYRIRHDEADRYVIARDWQHALRLHLDRCATENGCGFDERDVDGIDLVARGVSIAAPEIDGDGFPEVLLPIALVNIEALAREIQSPRPNATSHDAAPADGLET